MSERDTVIRNGRVQGGLQPTRAFGDAVYKWTNAQAAQYVAAYIRIVYFFIFFLADNNVFKESQRLSKQKAKNPVQADLGTIRLLM